MALAIQIIYKKKKNHFESLHLWYDWFSLSEFFTFRPEFQKDIINS